MKILWLINIPSPYRVEFFSMLGKHCDLTVVFEKASSGERDKSWEYYSFESFRGIILNGVATSTDMAFNPSVLKYISADYDAIIVSNFLSPTGMLAIAYLKAKKIPYYLESDGGFYSKNHPLVASIKKFAMTGAKGYFSTGKEHDEYYIKNGAPKELMIRYPFSSVKDENVLKEPLAKNEKEALRKELGITENGTVVFTVGQFIHRKGFDILLQAVKGLDLTCYFIGGTPTSEYLELAGENVKFVPFMKKEQLYKWLSAGDIFVLPTRYDIWGLVVNEAMAVGLPVITTDKCLAGLEMVKNGVNGYIVESENVDALQQTLTQMMESDCSEMVENSLITAKEFTIEKMVRQHIDVLGIRKEDEGRQNTK